MPECDLLGPKTKEVSKRGGEKNTTTMIQAIVGFKLLCKGAEGEREKERAACSSQTRGFFL